MKLGYYYHAPAKSAGGKAGFLTPGHQGRFIESLSGVCRQVRCLLHEPDEGEICDYPVDAPNAEWVRLPRRGNAPRRLFFGGSLCRTIKKRCNGLDALLIRGPTPLLPPLVRAMRPLPVVLLLVGDYLAGADDLAQALWRRPFLKGFLRLYDALQTSAARDSLTFVNAPSLAHKYREDVPHLVETRTTTLSANDFFDRDDTCLGNPARLLYTGRYAREKGLLDLVEVLRLLVDDDLDVCLEMAGWEEPGTHVMRQVRASLEEAGLEGRFTDHGFQSIGPALFSLYKRADIFVMASRSSFEGFPRVIWEAMAHSLPVVATRVGAAPSYLTDGRHALLARPQDPQDLAAKVKRIINDGALRRALIRNGRALARGNSCERHAAEMVEHIEEFIAERRLSAT